MIPKPFWYHYFLRNSSQPLNDLHSSFQSNKMLQRIEGGSGMYANTIWCLGHQPGDSLSCSCVISETYFQVQIFNVIWKLNQNENISMRVCYLNTSEMRVLNFRLTIQTSKSWNSSHRIYKACCERCLPCVICPIHNLSGPLKMSVFLHWLKIMKFPTPPQHTQTFTHC